jgi:hypothetical protein
MSDDDNEINMPEQSSFAVVVTPVFSADKEWTGAVSVHMEEDDLHDLTDDELMQVRSVCGMMAATLTLMEEDEVFNEKIQEYFLANYKSFIEDAFVGEIEMEEGETRPKLTRSKDGKVITLDFSSKTYGNA